MAKSSGIQQPVLDALVRDGLREVPHDEALGDGAELESALVTGLRGEVTFAHVVFLETRIEHADIPVLKASRARWREVELASSRIGSADCYESEWNAVHLIGCKLGYLNLRGAELEDVRFTDCTIEELDLSQSRVARMAFDGCRIDRLDVQHARLQHVDLRGADFAAIDGIESLRGAVVSAEQLLDLAPLLAGSMGIVVAG